MMAKHAAVYPSAEELEAVQSLVSAVEGGLKSVSDWLIDSTKANAFLPTESAEPNPKLVSLDFRSHFEYLFESFQMVICINYQRLLF